MLSFFRRFLRSRYGTPVTVGFLIVLMAAFGLGDLLSFNRRAALADNDISTVGSEHVAAEQVRTQVQQLLTEARQRNQDVTIQQFLAQDGLNLTIQRVENDIAVRQLADAAGIVAGKRLIDGEIASVPALHGLDGKFDQKRYEELLQQRNMSDAALRNDIRRGFLARWIVGAPLEHPFAPAQLAVPYSQMMLEHRTGLMTLIPAAAMPAGDAPTDQQLAQYYADHKLRYIVPERRVIRYALVTPEQIQAKAVPTDAELQAAYKAAKDKYAPVQKRTLRQLIVLDQATAASIAAKIKSGTTIDKAASDAKLSAATLKDLTKPALATQTSQALADAAFGAAKGAVIGPIKTSLGWHIAVVDAIVDNPGKSFEEARAELLPQVTQKKTTELLMQMAESIDSSTTGSTFDEIVSDNKLMPTTSPALLASGVNPDDPKTPADPKLAPALKAAFAMAADDDPAVVQLGQDNSFALVKLDRVVAAAPRPLAAIKDQVTKDLQLDRQLQAARDAATRIVRAIGGGTPFAAALAASGVKAEAPARLDLTRGQVLNAGAQVPPPAKMLFSMQPKQVRMLDAPNRAGFVIVYAESVEPGNVAATPQIVAQSQQQLARVTQQELEQQLLLAIRKQVKIARNPAAIQKLQNELSGSATE